MKCHELKTVSPFFEALGNGKTFEVRKHDRDFQVGDTLILNHYSPIFGYLGERKFARITYVLTHGEFEGVAQGYAVLGLGLALEIDPLDATVPAATIDAELAAAGIGSQGAEAELARLRRMADALCTIAGTTRGARGVVFCQVCNGSGLGIGIECVKHTATCDVAIHLDLPREKGDVE